MPLHADISGRLPQYTSSEGSGERVYEVLAGVHFATAGSGNTQQTKAEKGQGSGFRNAIGLKFRKWLKYLLMSEGSSADIQQNRSAFRDYIKVHDLGSIQPFYSAYPQATVLNIQAALSQV